MTHLESSEFLTGIMPQYCHYGGAAMMSGILLRFWDIMKRLNHERQQ
jgi:hypothetical protein